MLVSDHKYIAFFAYTEIYIAFFGKNIFCFNLLLFLLCRNLLFLFVFAVYHFFAALVFLNYILSSNYLNKYLIWLYSFCIFAPEFEFKKIKYVCK